MKIHQDPRLLAVGISAFVGLICGIPVGHRNITGVDERDLVKAAGDFKEWMPWGGEDRGRTRPKEIRAELIRWLCEDPKRIQRLQAAIGELSDVEREAVEAAASKYGNILTHTIQSQPAAAKAAIPAPATLEKERLGSNNPYAVIASRRRSNPV